MPVFQARSPIGRGQEAAAQHFTLSEMFLFCLLSSSLKIKTTFLNKNFKFKILKVYTRWSNLRGHEQFKNPSKDIKLIKCSSRVETYSMHQVVNQSDSQSGQTPGLWTWCQKQSVSQCFSSMFLSLSLCLPLISTKTLIFIFLKCIFYFREGEDRAETLMMRALPISCLLCTPQWGSSPKPRHMPWQGIEPWPTGS